MARKSVLVVVAVLIGVSVAVGVAVASAHSHKPHRNKLQFTIKFSPFFLLDLGQPGPSQGDQIVSNDRLLNASGHEVGHDGIACTMTDPSVPEAACQGSFILPGGQITMQFLNTPPSTKIGAITGGTGRYRTARGEVKIVEPATGNLGSVTFALAH